MKIKNSFRLNSAEKKFCLFRLMWEHQPDKIGLGEGYSAKLAFSLLPKILGWECYFDGWRLTVFGLSISYRRSYGGKFV